MRVRRRAFSSGTIVLTLVSLGVFVCLAPATLAGTRSVMLARESEEARLYEPFDVGLRVTSPVASNPFTDVSIEAVFTPDGGAPITVHGFCDATDGTFFRVRFCPSVRTRHTLRITYTDAAGSETFEGCLEVGWSPSPGFARVDPRFPGRFILGRTGETWFHHGCSAYALALASEAESRAYVDRMTGYGFNRCRIVLAGGVQFPFSDREMNPFAGDDFTRFDLAYWRMIERRIAYMKERGMTADVIFLINWGGFINRFIERHRITDAEWLFFRYAIDRLAAFTNLTWNLGNEYDEFHSEDWADEMGARIKAADPYGHLLTAHQSSSDFRHAGDAWADSVCLQAYAGGTAVTVRTDWEVLRAQISRFFAFGKPIVNDEYGYEAPYPTDVVRRTHWANVFAGAYATYGSFESQSIRQDDPRLFGGEVADGQLAHLLALVRTLPMHLLLPCGSRVLESEHPAFCRALRGHEYAVYLPDGGRVVLDLSDVSGASLPIEWWVPATGQRIGAGMTGGAPVLDVVPPFSGDALLHIGRSAPRERTFLEFDQGESVHALQGGRGRWVVHDGLLVQPDQGTPTSFTWLRGRVYRDAWVDTLLRVAGPPGRRAGLLLRSEDPATTLSATGTIAVASDSAGRIEIYEVRAGTPTRLADEPAARWNPMGFNRLRVGLVDNLVVVFVNDGPPILANLRNPRPAGGYVGLFAERVPAAFDRVRVLPVLFRDFDDGSLTGLSTLAGVWRVEDSKLKQFSSRGGAARLGDASYRRFRALVSMDVTQSARGGGASIALRRRSEDDPFRQSGYLVHYDGARIVRFAIAEPERLPRVLASYQDPETGGILRRGGWNHFDVRATGSTFTVRVNGREVFTVADPDDRWPQGTVQLFDLEGHSRFDNVSVVSLDGPGTE